MNIKSRLTLILILAVNISMAQIPANKWERLNYLIGDWTGEGNGKPGQGGGTFSFQLDLDKNILVRKSHSEYAATQNKPATAHDDLMIVYLDYSGSPNKAIYFDNEGHTINYSLTSTENSLVFTSDIIEKTPRFRLTYTKTASNSVKIKFEFAPPGQPEAFSTYIEGAAHKKS